VFSCIDRRDFAAAENAYFALALGSQPWRIGVYGGEMNERSKTATIHRSTLTHVMNNEVVRKAMTATKSLMSEAARQLKEQGVEIRTA
jgi:hypothetical protein